MKASLNKRGDYSHINKHNLLEDLALRDQHPVQAIVDLESNLIDINKQLREVSHKIEYGDIGGNLGFVSRPRYIKNCEYDHKGLLVREVFEGDMSKVIEYEYNVDEQLISKIVTRSDGKEFVANYFYNRMGLLESENNNGTEESHIYTSGGIALYLTKREVVNGTSKVLVCDVASEFAQNNMGTIIGIELIAQNTATTVSSFSIEREGKEITTSIIESFDTQKYFLGISKSIEIYARGNLDIEVNISYIKNDPSIVGDNPDLITMVSNIGNSLSSLAFRYDNILQSVDNASEDSFTDLMLNDHNVYQRVEKGVLL